MQISISETAVGSVTLADTVVGHVSLSDFAVGTITLGDGVTDPDALMLFEDSTGYWLFEDGTRIMWS